jgi:hypothetical protein
MGLGTFPILDLGGEKPLYPGESRPEIAIDAKKELHIWQQDEERPWEDPCLILHVPGSVHQLKTDWLSCRPIKYPEGWKVRRTTTSGPGK